MKYYIIPTADIAMEVETADKYAAMDEFALKMDSDMNAYFRAVTEKEYKKIKQEREWEAKKNVQVDFYIEELRDNFDVPEEEINDVAEQAYEIYCEAGHGEYCTVETEYDALERAYDEWYEESHG